MLTGENIINAFISLGEANNSNQFALIIENYGLDCINQLFSDKAIFLNKINCLDSAKSVSLMKGITLAVRQFPKSLKVDIILFGDLLGHIKNTSLTDYKAFVSWLDDLRKHEHIFLDTETTGLSFKKDRIVDIAIVANDGQPIFNSLINPCIAIPKEASAVHGITDSMVSTAPTLDKVYDIIKNIVRGKHIVIYNAGFDPFFFPDQLNESHQISCCMIRFSDYFSAYSKSNKWQSLDIAAKWANHKWDGIAHRALADAQACRSVWRKLDKIEKPLQ